MHSHEWNKLYMHKKHHVWLTSYKLRDSGANTEKYFWFFAAYMKSVQTAKRIAGDNLKLLKCH